MPTPDPSSRCDRSTASRSSPAPPSSPPNFRAPCSPIGDCPYLPIGRASRCARKCSIPRTASLSPCACSIEPPLERSKMKIRILAAALATAFACPAFGADAPKDPTAPAESKAHNFDFRFNFDLDGFDLLADATAGAQRGTEVAREQAEHMREWAQNFSESMQ